MSENLSPAAIKCLLDAVKWAVSLGHPSVSEQHLLLSLLENETLLSQLLNASGSTTDRIIQLLSDAPKYEVCSSRPIRFSDTSLTLLTDADIVREQLGHEVLYPDHISIALLETQPMPANSLIQRLGVDADTVNSRIKSNFDAFWSNETRPQGPSPDYAKGLYLMLLKRDPEAAGVLRQKLRGLI